jgi:hypothetical protein
MKRILLPVTIFLKLRCQVAAMAIKKEEWIVCSSFGFRTPVKYLFKRGHSDVAIRPSSG